MKRRNILAILIAAAMMFTLAMPAMAENERFTEEEDFLDPIEVDVTATITEVDDGAIIYAVDITWGDMQFEFNLGGETWNPYTHEYEGATNAHWVAPGDQENGLVLVANHSNIAIDAEIEFTMNANAFGSGSTVVGSFYDDKQDALNVTAVADGSPRTNVKFELYTAEGRSPAHWEQWDENVQEVYFALSGTPGDVNLTDEVIGKITITITPYTDDDERNQPKL